MASSNVQTVVTLPTKSVAVALVLAGLFGPLGMLYSTILGGIVMGLISIVVGIITVGFGLVVVWPICVLWAVIAANSHNKKMLARYLGPSSAAPSDQGGTP